MTNLEAIPQPSQADSYRSPRQKTREEYGAQVGRIVNKLFERAQAIPHEHRMKGINGIQLHTANVYGSTGRAADSLRTGDHGHHPVVHHELVGIQRWRERNETHGDDESRMEYLRDVPGPATGAITINRFGPDAGNTGRANFIDMHSENWGAPLEQSLRPGTNNIGGMDRAVHDTARSLAFTRQTIHEAEMRQHGAE